MTKAKTVKKPKAKKAAVKWVKSQGGHRRGAPSLQRLVLGRRHEDSGGRVMSKEKTYAEIIVRLSAWSSDELEAVQAMLVRFERGRAQHGGWTKEAKMDYRKERLEEIMDLAWYGSMMDAAHPAPPGES